MKVCRYCEVGTEFYNPASFRCKDCTKAEALAYRVANREEIAAKERARRGPPKDRKKRGPVTYTAYHYRVYALYGKASDYPCFTQCCRPAMDWACVGNYANTEEYVPMCRLCHRGYDAARRKALRCAS